MNISTHFARQISVLIGTIIFTLLLSGFLSPSPAAYALQGVGKQVFPGATTATEPFGFIGNDAYVTTPNPSIISGWAAAVVSITEGGNAAFIESGAVKDCNESSSCPLRAYAAYRKHNGTGYTYFSYKSILLGAGVQYRYWQNRINTQGDWQAVWCNGSGCQQLLRGSLGTTGMGAVYAGGETSGGAFGSATFKYNTYTKASGGTNVSYCYKTVTGFGNPNPPSSYASACNTTENRWSVSF
jgi:hypothetical protein